MSMRISRLALLMVSIGLVACAGPHTQEVQPREITYYPTGFDPEKDPYWEDPRWQKVLLIGVQSVVHDPVDQADISAPPLHAIVKFVYLDGTIEYPGIVESTGNPDLDKLILHQVASVHVPSPADLQTNTAHKFELDLNVPTPLDNFESTIYAAIDARKVYPKSPVIHGVTGNTTVEFDYLDGKASVIAMVKSSEDSELDKAAVGAVTHARLPQAPAAYAGKVLHIEVIFCYSIKDQGYLAMNPCPAERNVIAVQGERIRR